MQNTSQQYDTVVSQCRQLFINKMTDYGSAWRILRLPSLTDQIFIKAQRIRSLQQNTEQKVDEGQESEFIGIINYCLLYDKYISETKALMEAKNHDYGEAWRDMRVSSLTDLILQKLLRVKQIDYQDMINYSIFAMIHLS